MSLHPLSVPYKIVSRGLIGVFFVLLTFGEGVVQLFTGGNLFMALAVGVLTLVGFGVYVAWEILYYKFFRYRFSGDQVEIESGVFFQREREIPVRRIQNVDVKRNLVHRMLGIAAVNLESAGGQETEASLNYVSHDEAQRIQDEIRSIKQRSGDEQQEDSDEPSPSTTTERQPIFTFNGTEFTLFCLLPPNIAKFTVLGLIVLGLEVILAIGSLMTYVFYPSLVSPLFSLLNSTVVSLLFFVFILPLLVLLFFHLSAGISHFLQYYDFSLSREGDSLEYERGLFTRLSGSIPTDKIQKLTIRENLIMRYLGYVSLSVETAGYGPAKAQEGQTEEAVVPMARKDRALELARSIEPFQSLHVQRPPKRVKWRYGIRYTLYLLLGLLPMSIGIWVFQQSRFTLKGFTLPGWLPYGIIGSILLFAPLTFLCGYLRWKPLGYAGQENHFLVREGYLNRVTTIIPYFRVQTMTDRRSFLQRRWDLSTVIVDTAGSFSLLSSGNRAIDVGDDIAEEITRGLRQKLHETLV